MDENVLLLNHSEVSDYRQTRIHTVTRWGRQTIHPETELINITQSVQQYGEK